MGYWDMAMIWQNIQNAMKSGCVHFVDAWNNPIAELISIVLSTLFACFVLRNLIALFSVLYKRGNKGHQFHIKVNASAQNEIVYLNTATMDRLFQSGHRPEVVKLRGKGKLVRANLARRNKNKLKDDWIEVSSEMYRNLFPKDEIPEAEEANNLNDSANLKNQTIEIRPFASRGISGFWFEPNIQLRFQNRFAVYLSVGLMFLQIFLELGLRT